MASILRRACIRYGIGNFHTTYNLKEWKPYYLITYDEPAQSKSCVCHTHQDKKQLNIQENPASQLHNSSSNCKVEYSSLWMCFTRQFNRA